MSAPSALGGRPCELAFGLGGHTLIESRRGALQLPTPVHEYFDRDADVWCRWTRFGVLPTRRKTQDEA